MVDIIWRYSTKCERFQLSNIVLDHNDTRVPIVLLYGSFYTNNSIFKSDRGSNACKVIVKNSTHLIAVNDCIIVFSENNIITIPRIHMCRKRGIWFSLLISNHKPSKVGAEITYSLPDFNGFTVKV